MIAVCVPGIMYLSLGRRSMVEVQKDGSKLAGKGAEDLITIIEKRLWMAIQSDLWNEERIHRPFGVEKNGR